MRDHSMPAPAWPRWLTYFCIFAVVFLIGTEAYSIKISPADADMGHLQKIMYVHVPAAWMYLLSTTVVFVYSLLYLAKRNPLHDLAAASAAEVAFVLTALTLALGSIWGRPTWGVYWTWDPRLTATAVSLLLMAGYLALRAFTDDDDRRARWSAAVGILAFLNVPIVYMSVRWWRSIHQIQSNKNSVDPEYALGLELGGIAFLFVMSALVLTRYHIAQLERAIETREEEAALQEGEVHV
jgi:heme exporter protein C